MNFGSLLTATLLFSVSFCAIALLLAYEYSIGAFSPRGLGIALAGLVVAGAIAVAHLLNLGRMRKYTVASRDPDSRVKENKVRAIWIAKIVVVVLMLAFLSGLWHITEKPIGPRLVGLGANLLITFAIIGAIQRMQRGSK